MKQILEQLAQLNLDIGKRLSSGSLSAEATQISQHNELLDIINDFLPADGWICYQSQLDHFQGLEKLPEIDQATGLILQAEFVQTDNDSNSLHIRQQGTQGWIATHISQITPADETETGILETSQFITMPDENSKTEGYLRYQTYWKPNKNGEGYHKALSRLLKLAIRTDDKTDDKIQNPQEVNNASA